MTGLQVTSGVVGSLAVVTIALAVIGGVKLVDHIIEQEVWKCLRMAKWTA